MPLEKCSVNGRDGFRWGSDGKCYTGPDAKKKALKQGYAEDPKHFKEEMTKSDFAYTDEAESLMIELENFGASALDECFDNPGMEAVSAYISQKKRDKIPDEDFGDPENKKYPIMSEKDVESAARLLGRAPASKQAAIKERIKKIARRKGYKLPESWS